MTESSTVHIVASNWAQRAHLARLSLRAGHHAETYASVEEFVAHAPSSGLVLSCEDPSEATVPELIAAISKNGHWLPVIGIADRLDSTAIVRAIKAGALDYLPLPERAEQLSDAIARSAPAVDRQRSRQARAAAARERLCLLSQRERAVLDLLSGGESNKSIARILGISPRTVEVHRLSLLKKLGSLNSVDAARMKFEATELGGYE
ncbi:LuxR C-terminal-related transcriptional regulator [Novosphingobium sp.]|uniref:response regulator transcription factor n=1 Tax=Novosphingobium sp. TaxID=1874826 RepID=UPI00333E605D